MSNDLNHIDVRSVRKNCFTILGSKFSLPCEFQKCFFCNLYGTQYALAFCNGARIILFTRSDKRKGGLVSGPGLKKKPVTFQKEK